MTSRSRVEGMAIPIASFAPWERPFEVEFGDGE